jgi:peptide/nickel transport system substrate-binding protein
MVQLTNIDRREYLAMLGASGVFGLAGCTQSTTEDGETILTVVERTSPDTVNPIMTAAAEGTIAARWAYSSLTQINWNGEVLPDLALDWESNDTADVWTFTLRDDATFYQSGNSVLAEDVKATFDTIYDSDVGSPGMGSLGPIDSVNVVNDTTVELSLERPYVDIPRAVALNWGLIVEKNALEERFDELSETSYGSGPFILEEFESGDHATFVRNDDYYLESEDGDQYPLADGIEHQYVPESSSRINILQRGEADILRVATATEFPQIQEMGSVDPRQVEGGWVFPIILNHNVEPFDDNRVRQAFKYAIDNEAMVERANNGFGQPAVNHSPAAPINDIYTTDLTPDYGTTAQPEQAQDLLEEAGYADGIEIEPTMQVPSERAAPVRDIAVLAQEQLAEVGITFDIEEVTWDYFLSNVSGQGSFFVTSYSAWEVPYQGMHIQLHSDGAWNGVQWGNEEYDEAIEAAVESTDTDEREQYYREAQQIAHENAGYVVPFNMPVLGANQETVTGHELDPFQQNVYAQRITK